LIFTRALDLDEILEPFGTGGRDSSGPNSANDRRYLNQSPGHNVLTVRKRRCRKPICGARYV